AGEPHQLVAGEVLVEAALASAERDQPGVERQAVHLFYREPPCGSGTEQYARQLRVFGIERRMAGEVNDVGTGGGLASDEVLGGVLAEEGPRAEEGRDRSRFGPRVDEVASRVADHQRSVSRRRGPLRLARPALGQDRSAGQIADRVPFDQRR